MARGPTMFGDLPPLDPAQHAADALNAVLEKKEREKREEAQAKILSEVDGEAASLGEVAPVERRVDVRHALRGGPILTHSSDRDLLRLLILTRDLTFLTTSSPAQRRLVELARMFAEVHVIVLSEHGHGPRSIVRLGSNIWLYPTYSRYWWQTGIDAYRIAREQLAFAQGFRADIVIAEDPFESGVAACLISGKYERPMQIHVYENPYDPMFREFDECNEYRYLMALYVFFKARSIRTKTETIRNAIFERWRGREAYTEVLPAHHNLAEWRDSLPAFDLHARYPQFKFLMLHISNMTNLSHTDSAINGVLRTLKQYPSVGLVIVGSGPYRSMYEKHVLTLGLQNQVVFEPMPSEVISHMKTANLLIHLSEDPEEEDLILQAAAAKLPMLAGAQSIAGELFLDGESAFICVGGNPICIEEKVNTFLNDNRLGPLFAVNAQDIVFSRIEQNFGAYMDTYRSSVERCIADNG